METKIQKWGNSQGIRIPKNILDSMEWDTNQTIDISTNINNNEIIIRPTNNSNQYLERLFADFDGDYNPEEFDWGKAVGNEVW